jgi:hypothetical protein
MSSLVVQIVLCSVIKKCLQIAPSIAEANFHAAFDNGRWLLVPEDHIIEKFHKTLDKYGFANRKDFPSLPVRRLIMN